MLRIGLFSQISGVSAKALRFYADIGLFRPAFVDGATGYRFYTTEQLPRLHRIIALKDLGVSLDDIAPLLALGWPTDRIRDALFKRRADILDHIRSERDRLNRIKEWLELLPNANAHGDSDVFVRRVKPQLVARTRSVLNGYGGADELFAEVQEEVRALLIGGERIAVWHRCAHDVGPIDCEAALPVRTRMSSKSRVSIIELPAGTMACVLHAGDEQSEARAYSTVRTWIAAQGYAVVGPVRERYWHQRRSEERLALTEIQFPIGAKHPGTRGQ